MGKWERGKGRELVQVTRLESLGGVKGRELLQVTRLESLERLIGKYIKTNYLFKKARPAFLES